MAVLWALLQAAQAVLAYLKSQCDVVRVRVNSLKAENKAAAVREVTAIGNVWAAEVALHTLSCDVITARRRENRMNAVFIELGSEVDDCLDAFSLCR